MRFPRFSPNKENLRSPTQASAQQKWAQEPADEALMLAHVIHGAGMGAVASFAIGVLKPLHWIGGQALWIAQPFMDALSLGARRGSAMQSLSTLSVANMAGLLEREDGLDELAANLERLRCEPDKPDNGEDS